MPARARGARRSIDMIRRKYENRLAIMPKVYEVQTTIMRENLPRMLIVTQLMDKIYGILDAKGVYGEFRIPYLNYARRLIHLKLRVGGDAYKKAVAVERAKFLAKGLDPEVLSAIESEIGAQPTPGAGGGGRIA